MVSHSLGLRNEKSLADSEIIFFACPTSLLCRQAATIEYPTQWKPLRQQMKTDFRQKRVVARTFMPRWELSQWIKPELFPCRCGHDFWWPQKCCLGWLISAVCLCHFWCSHNSGTSCLPHVHLVLVCFFPHSLQRMDRGWLSRVQVINKLTSSVFQPHLILHLSKFIISYSCYFWYYWARQFLFVLIHNLLPL